MIAGLKFLAPGGREISYPPRPDIRYGELVRLRNMSRKSGCEEITKDLQRRIDRFFRSPEKNDAQFALFN